MGMDIPESYQQISEQDSYSSLTKEPFIYFHCYQCGCVAYEKRETSRSRGCELHPECRCNTDIFFHRIFDS